MKRSTVSLAARSRPSASILRTIWPRLSAANAGTMPHQFGLREIGAEADQTGIERHQFALRTGRGVRAGSRKAGEMVDFDDDFRELGIADGEH